MIEHKLLYYPRKAQFEQEKDNIADTSIAFIEDSGTIYTHKHEFGGNGGGTNTEYTYEISKQYTDDQVTQTVGRIMDAVDAKIKDFASKSYVNSSLTAYMQGLNITDRVEQILNAKEPSWTALVSRIGSLEGQEQNILEQIASIKAQIVDDGNGGSYPQITLETIYSLLNGDDDTAKEIAARIFMLANESGSEIHLDADRIYFGSDTNNNQLKMYIRGAIDEVLRVTVTDPDTAFTYAVLLASGLKFQDDKTKLWLTLADGLKHTDIDSNSAHNGEHGYWLKKDGSGELAFGNITWDSDGNLTTHGLMLKEAEAMGAANSFIVDSVILCPTYERPGVSWFQSTNYFTIINYHICKAGFIIKQGEARLDSQYFMQTPSSPENFVSTWSGSTYGVAANSTLYTVGYRAYKLPIVTAQSILATVSQTVKGETWESLIKNDDNDYIFENGDNVYVSFPSQISIVNANPGSIFVGVIDGNDQSAAFEAESERLANAINQSLTNDGTWTSPIYTYRGEYDNTTTYSKNDVVSVFSQNTGGGGALYIKNNYLCVKDDVTSEPDPNETASDDRDWIDCLYDMQDSVLNAAGDLSGSAANSWNYGTPVDAQFTYIDDGVSKHPKLYHVEGTYQRVISANLDVAFQIKPMSFYGSHIIQWNNSGFNYILNH